MKKLPLLALAVLLALTAPADACTKWWKGGGSSANWSATANTNWALSDGGANNAAVPISTDDVCFTALSGSSNSILDTSTTIQTLVMTGYTGTLTMGSVFVGITGNTITYGTGMTWAASGTATWSLSNAATQTTITSNGKSGPTLAMSTVGLNVLLADAFTTALVGPGGFSIRHDNGTFNTGGNTLNLVNFQSNSATARTLTLGASTIKLSQGGTNVIWQMATTTNLTLSANTATVEVLANAAASNGRSIQLGSIANWPSFLLDAGIPQLAPIIFSCAAGCTLPALTVNGPNYFETTAGQTTTLSTPPVINGALGSPVTWASSTPGTSSTVSMTSGTMSCAWCALRDLTFSGGGTFNAGKSFDLGHNSGVTISPPTGALLGG